jgi:hypothetical protein
MRVVGEVELIAQILLMNQAVLAAVLVLAPVLSHFLDQTLVLQTVGLVEVVLAGIRQHPAILLEVMVLLA